MAQQLMRPPKKKRRWDQTQDIGGANENQSTVAAKKPMENDDAGKWNEGRNQVSAKDMETPLHRVWDPTPGHAEPGATTPPDLEHGFSETPRVKSGSAAGSQTMGREKPKTERGSETPAVSGWAETPKVERLEDDSVVISKQAYLNASAAAARGRFWLEETLEMGRDSCGRYSIGGRHDSQFHAKRQYDDA